MKKVKILLTSKIAAGEYTYLIEKLDEQIKNKYELVVPDEYGENELLKFCEDVDVLLGSYITKTIIEKSKRLKLIQLPWTGIEYLNFHELSNCSIPICNTHSNSQAVAEYAVTLLLNSAKQIFTYDKLIRNGVWKSERDSLKKDSLLISDMKICILGYGNIGKKIASLLKPFNANIWAVANPHRKDDLICKIYDRSELQKAVHNADAIINTIPLTDDTKGMIDSKVISCMKDEVIIVNVSRALVIDEKALYQNVVEKRIKVFASDVWWKEPKSNEEKCVLSNYDIDWNNNANVILSPHRADLINGRFMHVDDEVENICNIYYNKKLKNRIEINRQY